MTWAGPSPHGEIAGLAAAAPLAEAPCRAGERRALPRHVPSLAVRLRRPRAVRAPLRRPAGRGRAVVLAGAAAQPDRARVRELAVLEHVGVRRGHAAAQPGAARRRRLPRGGRAPAAPGLPRTPGRLPGRAGVPGAAPRPRGAATARGPAGRLRGLRRARGVVARRLLPLRRVQGALRRRGLDGLARGAPGPAARRDRRAPAPSSATATRSSRPSSTSSSTSGSACARTAPSRGSG